MINRILRKLLRRNKDFNKDSLEFAARRRMAGLVAYSLFLNTETLRAGKNDGSGRRRALILNAGKSGVAVDFKITFDEDPSFDLVTWPSFGLRRIARTFLPADLLHDNYTSTDPRVEAAKKAYRAFLAKVWLRYMKLMKVDVVLSSNFGYFMQREFAAALEEAGTPFIVLHKENLKSPGRVDFWHKVYKTGRGAFSGRKILVYNETERDLQVSSGVIDERRIAVTGMPRLDRIHKWRRNMALQGNRIERPPQVLLFGWGLYDKIATVTHQGAAEAQARAAGNATANGAGEKPSWREIRKGTYDAMLRLARQRPDINVVVKEKPISSRVSDDVELLRDEGGLPDNIKLVANIDPFKAIIQSDVIIGFNTTALLEAIASGKPVIVPCFAEGAAEAMKEWIIDLGDSVQYARSPEELIDLIKVQIDNRGDVGLELEQKAADALKYWVGNDDGGAGHRVLEEIRAEIRGGS